MSGAFKSCAVQSWHQQTFEKRPIKRHARQGPDVYPQEPRQEEDNLCHEKLKKGYLIATTTHEHESMLFASRQNRAERIEDCSKKASVFIMMVMNKKGDINMCLDKEKKKNSNANQIAQQAGSSKTKERAAWFSDLGRGKALSQLVKKPPIFKRREDALEFLLDYKINSYRAIWYLKLAGTIQYTISTQKTRKSPGDASAAEWTTMFQTILSTTLDKLREITDISSDPVYRERWLYFAFLSKQAYEEGVVERTEFLNILCTIFCENFITRENGKIDTWSQLRIYMNFLIQFTEQFCLSILSARRLAHLLARKLSMMKDEYDEFYDENTTGAEAFEKMVTCGHKRTAIYYMSAMLQCICIDIPAALVWNKFMMPEDHTPDIPPQFCGSPLDLLPCSIHELPVPPGPTTEKYIELVKMRNEEIVRRSLAVENKWASNQNNQTTYAHLIESCLKVIGNLDSHDIMHPKSIDRMCNHVFNFKSDDYEMEMTIRIRLLFQWAVSIQREGTHRAVQVAKILSRQVQRQESLEFAGRELHDIILEYLHTEGPQPGEANYFLEYGNMMLLFTELMRFDLFSHDRFVKDMIKTGEMSYDRPLMPAYLRPPDASKTINQFEDLTPEPPQTVNLITPLPENKNDDHILMEEPGMTHKHRLLIQLPLRQIEDCRSESNQRAIVLWGMGDIRDTHIYELKEVAREISRIWQKKCNVRFRDDSTDGVVYCRMLKAEKLQGHLMKFRKQTYFDQSLICGWCAESYMDMIRDFAYNGSFLLPNHEGLDILLSMFEHARCIYGIFELCEVVVPLYVAAEKVIRGLRSDCIPGSFSGQHSYVLVSYLAKNWHYFIHSQMAPDVVNMLYTLTERSVRARDFPITGWSRTVAVFAYHAKQQLRKSRLTDVKLLGKSADYSRIFFHGLSITQTNMRYNSLFFRDVFEASKFPFRFPSYHEYKKRLRSFNHAHNRYSFVVNAMIAAFKCKRDYERLNDLATFCSHFTAHKPIIADEWIGAIKALCCSSMTTHLGYGQLLLAVNINDCSTHYSIATFTMLLASKYCFSVPKLVAELLNNVFPAVMKKEHGKADHDSEPGVCLALLIIAQIMCQTDEPFTLSEHYVGTERLNRLLPRSADAHMLSMIHWNEIDNVLFPMLANVCILVDTLRLRNKDTDLVLPVMWSHSNYMPEYLHLLVKAVQTTVCEMDWVTTKMYRIVESDCMEAFNSDRLKQNSLGQQLLRLGTRRRCERKVIQQLAICNGNSKKALLDKLFSEMNIWNLRATLFDVTLMIKEISPEGSQKHGGQNAIAANALIEEIGKTCRDLFLNSHKMGDHLTMGKLGRDFRFRDITNHWLVSSLVRLCPTPTNLPSSYPNCTVPGKFLKEAATMLDTVNDNSKERIHQSAWLLSQQPFLHLIVTCVKNDHDQPKDHLINSILKQLQHIILRAKENPSISSRESFAVEREGLLLRLSLIGRMFKQICNTNVADIWCLLFFQLILYKVVTPSRDRIMYDTCYDMICNLIIWSLTDSTAYSTVINPSDTDIKFKWITYQGIMKKLKRELSDQKVMVENRHLLHLMSFPKNNIDIVCTESYGNPPPAIQKLSKSGTTPTAQTSSTQIVRHKRLVVQPGSLLQPFEKQKLSTYDLIQYYIPDPVIKKGWNWSWFMASKLDRNPSPIQKFVSRMINHKHYNEYHRPNYILTESPTKDIFLSAPVMEATGEVIPSTSSASNGTADTKSDTKTDTKTETKTDTKTDTKDVKPATSSTTTLTTDSVKEETKPLTGPTPATTDVPNSTTGTPTETHSAGSETPDLNRSTGSNPTASPRTSRGTARRKSQQSGRSGGPRAKKAATAQNNVVTQNASSHASYSYGQPGWQAGAVAQNNSANFQPAASQPPTTQSAHTSSDSISSDSKTKIHNMVTKRLEEKANQQGQQNAQAYNQHSQNHAATSAVPNMPQSLDTGRPPTTSSPLTTPLSDISMTSEAARISPDPIITSSQRNAYGQSSMNTNAGYSSQQQQPVNRMGSYMAQNSATYQQGGYGNGSTNGPSRVSSGNQYVSNPQQQQQHQHQQQHQQPQQQQPITQPQQIPPMGMSNESVNRMSYPSHGSNMQNNQMMHGYNNQPYVQPPQY